MLRAFWSLLLAVLACEAIGASIGLAIAVAFTLSYQLTVAAVFIGWLVGAMFFAAALSGLNDKAVRKDDTLDTDEDFPLGIGA